MTLRKNSSTTAHPINPEPKRNILHLRIPFVLFLTTLFLSLPSAQAQLKINSHTLKLNNVFSIISNLYVDSIN